MAFVSEDRLEACHDHVVQFYGGDDELADGVVPYLAEAFEAGGVAVVIATTTHRQAFRDRLAGLGIDVAGAEESGDLVVVDALEAAEALLFDGRIAARRFDKVIAERVRDAAAGGRAVRAYGEIVALLWAGGHVTAALELEDLWNGLSREVGFSLYCAYPLASVEAEGGLDAVRAVCSQHSAVVGSPGVLSRLKPVAAPEPVVAPFELARTFEWGGRGPADARRFVTDTLIAWGRADLVDDAAVVVTELATNAVLHARTAFVVGLSRRPDGNIRLAVRDDSVVPPLPRLAGPYDGSGRGLRLVEVLAGGWTADIVPGGKVVWAQLGR